MGSVISFFVFAAAVFLIVKSIRSRIKSRKPPEYLPERQMNRSEIDSNEWWLAQLGPDLAQRPQATEAMFEARPATLTSAASVST